MTLTPELARFSLLSQNHRSYLLDDSTIEIVEGGPLGFASVLSMVKRAGARLSLNGRGQPVLIGKVPPRVMEGLSKNREEIREWLAAGQLADVEGLTCHLCENPPEPATGNYRYCPEHKNQPHYFKATP